MAEIYWNRLMGENTYLSYIVKAIAADEQPM